MNMNLLFESKIDIYFVSGTEHRCLIDDVAFKKCFRGWEVFLMLVGTGKCNLMWEFGILRIEMFSLNRKIFCWIEISCKILVRKLIESVKTGCYNRSSEFALIYLLKYNSKSLFNYYQFPPFFVTFRQWEKKKRKIAQAHKAIYG